MRAFIAAAIASGALALPAFAAGQQQNPYSGLFTGQLNGAPRPAPVQPRQLISFPPTDSAPNQTVVCGMTVLQGDSKIDPRMPQHPPANAPKPSITIIPAPACRK